MQQQRNSQRGQRASITTLFTMKFQLSFLFIFCLIMPKAASQGVCDSTPGSWDDLLAAIDENYGFVFLCPFTIAGSSCPSDTRGHRVSKSEVILICEPSYIGTERIGCVIDCPGTHFDVRSSGSLFLDGMTLQGATTSAIRIRNKGKLTVYNSIFEK